MKLRSLFILSIISAIIISSCKKVIDFENVSPSGPHFIPGNTFIDNNTGSRITILPFIDSHNSIIYNGTSEIVLDNKAGGSGHEISCVNACLGITFPKGYKTKEIIIKFWSSSHNINLYEHNTLHNYAKFSSIPSPTSSGLKIITTGDYQGNLKIIGDINEFYRPFYVKLSQDSLYSIIIGGQEISIDDIEFSD